MNKILFIGDIKNNNGPGNANKEILKSMRKNYYVRVCSKNNKILRILEILLLGLWSEKIFICSKSKANYWAIKIAKILNKEIIYLFHGFSYLEAKINDPNNIQFVEQCKKYDHYIIKNCNKLICVSKYFMKYMKEKFPEYNEKFDYIYNYVDVDNIRNNCISEEKNIDLLSVGGGIRRKNNINVAHAINNKNIVKEFVIVGSEEQDGVELMEISDVKWLGCISHEELISIMGKTKLYVQNSYFETFGLAVIEALFSGCSILISQNIGCKDIFRNLTNNDIIYNCDDLKEIEGKIRYLLKHPNHDRLIKTINTNQLTTEYQAKKIKDIISK